VAQWLLESGVDPNPRDRHDRTPLEVRHSWGSRHLSDLQQAVVVPAPFKEAGTCCWGSRCCLRQQRVPPKQGMQPPAWRS
jgi:hypothetical protein